ncbi:MAG: UDP-N-acetylmuramate dehydrogenase [Candidatus Omnitrophota bacterium]
MKTIPEIKIQEKLQQVFKGRIRVNEPLSSHTYIKIGGPVDLFLSPVDIEDLKAAVEFLDQANIPRVMIGKGSNLLVSDESLPIAAIKLNSPFFQEITKQDNSVYARAGVSLAKFINFSKNNRLSGSEFLAGIPGSIGGAIFMNAGTRNISLENSKQLCSISDIVSQVQVMDKHGNVKIIAKEDIKFTYRDCGLTDQIILAAWFELKPLAQEIIAQNIEAFLNNKLSTQELVLPNAGCIFKNPAKSKLSAGALIDQAKLKGCSIGDAEISFIHANFIVNKGNASFSQVRSLIAKIQETVENKYSICLEPEVKIWDKEGLK